MDSFRGDGLNLYTYVANNPINYIDPSGYCKDDANNQYDSLDDNTKKIIETYAKKYIANQNEERIRAMEEKMAEDMREAGYGGYAGMTIATSRHARGFMAATPFILRATPIIGTAIDIYELANNTDIFTGEQLSAVDKALTSAGLTISIVLPFADDIAKSLKLLVYGDNVYDYSNNTLRVVSGSFDDLIQVNTRTINPNEIRYSQSSVNGADDIIKSMQKNGWNGDPIDVVKMPDGQLTTIDNTRVVSATKVGIDVQAVVHEADELLPTEFIERFTTRKGVPTTWGEAIELRVGKQKASFRNGNPYGSYDIERVGQ